MCVMILQQENAQYCPMCGRKLRTTDEIEMAKGLALRKDIPSCLCLRDECVFNHGGECFCPPNPYELECSHYATE